MASQLFMSQLIAAPQHQPQVSTRVSVAGLTEVFGNLGPSILPHERVIGFDTPFIACRIHCEHNVSCVFQFTQANLSGGKEWSAKEQALSHSRQQVFLVWAKFGVSQQLSGFE